MSTRSGALYIHRMGWQLCFLVVINKTTLARQSLSSQRVSMLGCRCAGLLQGDAVASLAELDGNVGKQLAGLAAEHGQLGARLAEAEAAERKLDALAQLQKRLAGFDALLRRGALSAWPASDGICPFLSTSHQSFVQRRMSYIGCWRLLLMIWDAPDKSLHLEQIAPWWVL